MNEETIRVWVEMPRRRKVAVSARVSGPFAIHRGIWLDRERVRFYQQAFTLTHVPSGMSIACGLSQRQADQLLEAMRRPPLSDAFWRRIRCPKDARSKRRRALLNVAKARRNEILGEDTL